MIFELMTPQVLMATVSGASAALFSVALAQRFPLVGRTRKIANARPRAEPVLERNQAPARTGHQELRQEQPPDEPSQTAGAVLEHLEIARVRKAFDAPPSDIVKDGFDRWVQDRPPRARRAIAPAKSMELFVKWLVDGDYTGWYTATMIYEAYQEYAWDQRLEELDYRSFLAYLAAMRDTHGVQKKRAYVQRNETYRHLRGRVNGQEKATVYRIPTLSELDAARRKREMQDGPGRTRGLKDGQAKVRLSPGGREHPHGAAQPARRARNMSTSSDVALSDAGFTMAA